MPYSAVPHDVLANVAGHRQRKRMHFRDLKPNYGIGDRPISAVIHNSRCLTFRDEVEFGHHLITQTRQPKAKECEEMGCPHKEFCPLIRPPLFRK